MRKTSIGGQAVMEGVMMKSMDNMAVAVRRTDGQIAVQDRKLAPWTKKNRFFGMPFVRGAVNLADTMTLGMKVLTDSAMMAGLEEEEPTKFEKWLAKKTGKSALDVMMPMAIDSEKKSWPMAATTVIHEKFLTFGTRKYLTPSNAPGRVME